MLLNPAFVPRTPFKLYELTSSREPLTASTDVTSAYFALIVSLASSSVVLNATVIIVACESVSTNTGAVSAEACSPRSDAEYIRLIAPDWNETDTGSVVA